VPRSAAGLSSSPFRPTSALGGPELKGEILFLDIDIVIVGNMDAFFQQPGEFLIIRDWQKGDITGNSSVYRWTAGAHPDVLEYFRSNLEAVRKRHRNEQEFLTAHLSGQGRLAIGPRPGAAVLSAIA